MRRPMVEKRERLGCLSPSSLLTRCGLVETAFFCGTEIFRQASPTVSLGLEPVPCSINHALLRTLQALAWQLLPLLLLALDSYTMPGHALLISLTSSQTFVNVLLKSLQSALLGVPLVSGWDLDRYSILLIPTGRFLPWYHN